MKLLREMIVKVGDERKSSLVSRRDGGKAGGFDDDRHIFILIEYRVRREARIE
jgi:hypothetical protein